MAEVAFGNYHHQGYAPQQQYQHHQYGVPGNGYPNHNARFNPYQRPSPPFHQGRSRQSPPLMQYKAAPHMIARHNQYNQPMRNWGQNPNFKPTNEDFNANSQPVQQNWHNPHWGHQNLPMTSSRPVSSLSPPIVPSNYPPSASPLMYNLVNNPEQDLRRRMSSSSQSSDYSATSGVQGHNTDNRWVASPNSVIQNGQFNPQQQQCGDFSAPQVSPNPGVMPGWNPNLQYSTPSPMSDVSSDNSPPPPPMAQMAQQPPFRHPQVPQPPPRHPQPNPQIPIVPSEIPPGTTTGTSGSDWEVNCLGAQVKLRNCDLWKHFENVVMEMVISKHGRRMFPVLEYDVKGLHPNKLYSVFVDFVLANKYVWKFSEQKWNPSGLAPEEDIYDQSHRVCLHPESPAPGEVWNKRGVSFSKMKLSNHLHTDSDKLSLKSLHKYQPRLHVVEVDPRDPSIQTNLRTFIIPKTQFMTVTLYHNTDVAQLKINLNPFARCFRDKEISPTSKIENTPSPISRNDLDMSRVDDVTSTWNQTCDVTTEPNIVHKVQNPVPQADLEKAKEFMQQQLNTMTRLVRAQDALSGSQPTPATSTTVSTVDAGQIGVLDSNGGLTHVDFDRELEGLLGSYSAGSEQVISKEENKKKTVHHFGPETIKQENIKPPSAKRAKTNDSNPLDKYELLNVDRCFPPNAVAPLSNTLPFDLSKVKSESNNTDGSNTTLPTFFKCSYYQEQAAQAAISSLKAQDAKTNLPVVYVPKLSSAVKQSTSTSTPEPSKEKLDSSPAPLYQEQTPATRPLVFDDDTVVTSPNPTNVTSTKLTVMSVEDNDEVEEIGTSKNPDVCDVIDTSPAPSMTSSHESATPFDPYALPTLSPKSLQQFLDADINAMMSGHKRKCSFDDDLIDDDVFADQSSLMNACGIFNPQNQPFLSNIT